MNHPLTVSCFEDSRRGSIKQVLSDGRQIVRYTNGEEVVVHGDGQLEQSTADGTRISISHNGIRTETRGDGTVLKMNSTGELLSQEMPDGSAIYFHDGEKIEHRSDGSTKITHLDGSSVELNKDESHEVRILPDGTIVETDKDLRRCIKTMPNGSKEQTDSDGVVIYESADGDVLQINPDGSRSATSVNGTHTDILADGTIIVEHDGCVIQKEGERILIERKGKDPVQTCADDADIITMAILSQAEEDTTVENFLPSRSLLGNLELAGVGQNKTEETSKTLASTSIGHDTYSLLTGIARLFPESITCSTKYTHCKVTVGALLAERKRFQKEGKSMKQSRNLVGPKCGTTKK